jgi:3-oxoacyl-[acyl-carrier-protein] synthase-3
MNTCVTDLAYYLPERVIDNEFLAEQCGIDRAFLDQKVGIKERRMAAPDETTSSMAARAAKEILAQSRTAVDQIDLLILCTQNPDYRLPTTACLLHGVLGLSKDCACFDVNLGCSAFTYALSIADAMVKASRAKKALLVMADQYTKIIDYHDKNTAGLFGDAASAALLASCRDGAGILDVDLGTDGSGAMHLIAPNSGVAREEGRGSCLYMNSREIMRFSLMTVPSSIRRVLSRNGLEKHDVKQFVFHQANRYMLQEVQRVLQLAPEQMLIDMEKVGNTVSSSIPIAWKHFIDAGKQQPDDLLVLCGFGVGLSWGTVLYRCP